jgi:hypothetical protein
VTQITLLPSRLMTTAPVGCAALAASFCQPSLMTLPMNVLRVLY